MSPSADTPPEVHRKVTFLEGDTIRWLQSPMGLAFKRQCSPAVAPVGWVCLYHLSDRAVTPIPVASGETPVLTQTLNQQ